jgi:hypothetical protein
MLVAAECTAASPAAVHMLALVVHKRAVEVAFPQELGAYRASFQEGHVLHRASPPHREAGVRVDPTLER